jgi:hypothetical protein
MHMQSAPIPSIATDCMRVLVIVCMCMCAELAQGLNVPIGDNAQTIQ